MMYVSHIIMLYTLTLYSAVCQLYLNKTVKRKCEVEKELYMKLYIYYIFSYLKYICMYKCIFW